MTALEKAIELRDKYCQMFGLDHVDGCRAAIVAVEEIIQDRFDIDKQSSWWAQVLELLKCPLI